MQTLLTKIPSEEDSRRRGKPPWLLHRAPRRCPAPAGRTPGYLRRTESARDDDFADAEENIRIQLTFHVERDLRARPRARAVGGLADVGPGGRAVHALDHQRPLVDHDAAARVRKQFLPLKAEQEKSALVLSEKLGRPPSPLFPLRLHSLWWRSFLTTSGVYFNFVVFNYAHLGLMQPTCTATLCRKHVKKHIRFIFFV